MNKNCRIEIEPNDSCDLKVDKEAKEGSYRWETRITVNNIDLEELRNMLFKKNRPSI